MASSPDPSLSRRERERKRRRQAMLDAARTVFAERGYANATLDEIAERAEFGKGTLYNYFERGKEGLLFTVFDDTLDELEELIRTVFQEEFRNGRSLREAFHTFLIRYFELIHDQQDLFLVLAREAYSMALSDNPEWSQFFHRQHERLVDALVPALEKARETDEIQPNLPPSPIAHLLLANPRGMGIQRIMENRHGSCDEPQLFDDPEKAADFLTTILFDGLEGNGAPPTSA